MAMHGHDPGLTTAANYLAFAQEARDRSPAYERTQNVIRARSVSALGE